MVAVEAFTNKECSQWGRAFCIRQCTNKLSVASLFFRSQKWSGCCYATYICLYWWLTFLIQTIDSRFPLPFALFIQQNLSTTRDMAENFDRRYHTSRNTFKIHLTWPLDYYRIEILTVIRSLRKFLQQMHLHSMQSLWLYSIETEKFSKYDTFRQFGLVSSCLHAIFTDLGTFLAHLNAWE